jgi:hypothetical protein
MVRNILVITLLVAIDWVCAFSPSLRSAPVSAPSATSSFSLYAMKKRKRKQSPSDAGVGKSSTTPPLSSRESVDKTTQESRLTDDELALMKDIVNFEFKPDALISIGMYYTSLLDRILLHEAHLRCGVGVGDFDSVDDDRNQFNLPDIKDALRKREIDEEIARMAEEEKELKPKIKRSDTKAFQKVGLSLKCL